MVHVADALGIEARRRRLAEQRGARRADVERPQSHQGRVARRRPVTQVPGGGHDRGEEQGRTHGQAPPPVASVEVAQPVDGARAGARPDRGALVRCVLVGIRSRCAARGDDRRLPSDQASHPGDRSRGPIGCSPFGPC
jgi:hypothetical protein